MNKKNLKIRYLFFIVALLFRLPLAARETETLQTEGFSQSVFTNMEYRIKAGILIGGMAPLPFPLKIQKIESYKPLLNISMEAEIMKKFTGKWGLSVGVRLETKGMKTRAQVKNYQMRMIAEDGEIEGVWTGKIEAKVHNSYLTLPVQVVWKFADNWNLKLGPYISCMLEGNFSGYAYEGYLREGNPVGEKIEVDEAIYNFSSGLRRWNWGGQAGVEWKARPHLLTSLDFICGLNSIFEKKFDIIAYNMYPLYASLGFAYVF
jgi:hypothetical protein